MNPWGYLILDVIGALIFTGSIFSVKENGNFVVFTIGIFSITIPFGLSAFFMKPVLGGMMNALISIVFSTGALFCVFIILGGILALIVKAFECLDEWMEHHNEK